MAATITATLESATANSYATLAEANTFFETVPDSTTWDNKTDDQKNRALISACSELDSLNYYGYRCNEDQALKWPRNNHEVDGVSFACTTIPRNIKEAQYLLARELANDPTLMTGNKGTAGVAKKIKMGDMEIENAEASLATGTVNNIFDVLPWLHQKLGAYCVGGSGSYQVRVVRG